MKINFGITKSMKVQDDIMVVQEEALHKNGL